MAKTDRNDRRQFLKTAGAAIVGLAVGGVVGSALTPKQTVTNSTVPVMTTGTSSAMEPVRLGIPTFLSGPFVSSGEQVTDATKLAVAEIKQAGWLGRDIEVYTADVGGNTPDEVKSAFDTLLGVNKVHINACIWGTYGPGWDETLSSHVPLITGDTPLGVTQYMSAHPDVNLVETYGAMGTGRQQTAMLNCIESSIAQGYWKPRHDPPTMYILNTDMTWDTDFTTVLKTLAGTGHWQSGMFNLSRANKWSIVGTDLAPAGTLDFTPNIAKIHALDPDVVVSDQLPPADAGTFASQFVANPTKSLFCNSAAFAIPAAINVPNPKALEGILHFNGPGPIGHNPVYTAFLTNFQNAYGIPPTLDGTHQYDSVYIALKAVKAAGSLDPDAIYNSLFDVVHHGIEGNWAFDKSTKMYEDYPLMTPDQVFQIQENSAGVVNQYYSVYPPEVADATFQLPAWLK